MTFRLAHLSDCHLGPLPAARRRDLASKRVLGYLNWQRNRAKAFLPGTTDDLLADLRAHAPDHVAVTGDLVNIALEAEFENAGRFLAALGPPQAVTAVPGNHDAYVSGALRRFNHHCAPFVTSDTRPAEAVGIYPVVRSRGPLTLVGLSSAHASGPFMATGAVDRDQRAAMRETLLATRDTLRVVLVHHPPCEGAAAWHKRLENASALRAVWRETGAGFILHGHTHLPTRMQVDGPDGPIPVFGVASAAQAPGGHKPPASYTLFDVETTGAGWTVTATRRGYPATGGAITELRTETFSVPRAAQPAAG